MPIGPTDRGLLILTSLAEGPKHGYALMQDIESFAGVTLSPGTLYGALGRLHEEGLIESLPQDQRRVPYRITPAGSRALSEELARNAQITGVGLSRLASSA
jgi:DNA-binding PadR family transcriptional regulator